MSCKRVFPKKSCYPYLAYFSLMVCLLLQQSRGKKEEECLTFCGKTCLEGKSIKEEKIISCKSNTGLQSINQSGSGSAV